MAFQQKTLSTLAVLAALTIGYSAPSLSADDQGTTEHSNRSDSNRENTPSMTSTDSMSSKHHNMHSTTYETSGMRMSDRESTMQNLRNKSGKEFDQTFISEMISQHQEAIDMAQLAKTKAKNKSLRRMADDMIAEHSNHIRELQAMQSGNTSRERLSSTQMENVTTED